MWHIVQRQYEWVRFVTNIYETCVLSRVAEWPRDVWREKLMTLEQRWQGEQIWGGGDDERSWYKKGTNRIKSNGRTPFSEQVELEV